MLFNVTCSALLNAKETKNVDDWDRESIRTQVDQLVWIKQCDKLKNARSINLRIINPGKNNDLKNKFKHKTKRNQR